MAMNIEISSSIGDIGDCGNPVRHGPMLPTATRKKVILVKLDVRESWLAIMCLVLKNGVG
jgi:hypothetical protein